MSVFYCICASVHLHVLACVHALVWGSILKANTRGNSSEQEQRQTAIQRERRESGLIDGEDNRLVEKGGTDET